MGRSTPSALVSALVLVLPALACGPRSPQPDVPTYLEIEVGLTAGERQQVRYLTEGSDLVPVDLLLALANPATGRLLIDSMEDFGFLPSAASDANPYGLPIGWTTNTPERSPNQLAYVGVNCAACHTGRIDFAEQRLLIDGAPNLADIEGFGLAVRDAVVATLADPVATFELVERLARLRHPDDGFAALLNLPRDGRRFLRNLASSVDDRGGDGEAMASALQKLLRGASEEEAMKGLPEDLLIAKRDRIEAIFGVLGKYVPLVRQRAEFALRALRAIEGSPAAGPGRDDPWGLVRNVVFESRTELSAPTSIPALFNIADFDWYHADGNTTSILERDVTQAIALGAYVDPETAESSLRIANIESLEALWSKVRGPSWPEEILGPIDRDLAAEGRALFDQRPDRPDGDGRSCADCHGSATAVLVALDAIGTDRHRAEDFARPLEGEPFSDRIPAAIGPIIRAARESGIPPAVPTVWRTTGSYLARRLDGIWATAPYLHNGSVPTLEDLLRPVGERPVTFPLGHRDFDPTRVGYRTTVHDSRFVLDTRIPGNSNAGHEYGLEFTDDQRRALVEYLKTL